MIILIVANLTVTAAMFGVIWIIQIVHYPMLRGLNEHAFAKWHDFHSRQITFIVGPLMVAELGLSIVLVYCLVNIWSWAILSLTLAIWAATFLISVPLHNQLAKADLDWPRTEASLKKLAKTNWPRTILYSVKAILLVALFLSLVPSM